MFYANIHQDKPHELHIQGFPPDGQEENITKHRKRKAKIKKASQEAQIISSSTFSLQSFQT